MIASGVVFEIGLFAASARGTLVAFAIAAGLLGLCEAGFWTTVVELGAPFGGTAAGMMNTGGNAGGTLSPFLTPLFSGWLTTHYGPDLGWRLSLAIAGVIVVAGAALWLGVSPPVDSDGKPVSPDKVLREGSGADIIAAIRKALEALTFVERPVVRAGADARRVFRAAVSRLEDVCPELDVCSFILEVEEDEASQQWLASIGLPQFASAGAGSVIWSERNRVISSEITANAIGTAGIVSRSMSLWKGRSEPSDIGDSPAAMSDNGDL